MCTLTKIGRVRSRSLAHTVSLSRASVLYVYNIVLLHKHVMRSKIMLWNQNEKCAVNILLAL